MPMKETDLLHAWLFDQHPTDIQWRRVRLGQVPTKELARMYMVLLRWADAIIAKEGTLRIIEAKLRPMPGAFGQLELYKQLLPQTPEFSAYKNWPIEMVLLTAVVDLNMVELASKKGITYTHFSEADVNQVRRRLLLPTV